MALNPSKKPKLQRPFWQDIENILNSPMLSEGADGLLKGSLTGENWKNFLIELRSEIICKLQEYGGGNNATGFNGSLLGGYRTEKKKIERIYLRNLAGLYKNAEKAYKNVSG